jgi:HEPN domain-containing protein
MAAAATRSEFQQLAKRRLTEAKTLLDAGHYEGAYYLTGYAVEFALKACVCRRRMRSGIFPEKDFSKDLYTHDLEKLVRLAKLETDRTAWTQKHRTFGSRWGVVARWRGGMRYEMSVSPADANNLYLAVTAPKLGVLTWLQKHW